MPAEDVECDADVEQGHLNLTTDVVLALGSWTTEPACHTIQVRLTTATYRTHARACLETTDGSSLDCGRWVLLSYPDTWDTLAEDVASGTRWQLQMKADGDEQTVFDFTTE